MGLVNTSTAKGFSETRPIMILNKHIFWSQSVQKYLTSEAHFLVHKIGNLMLIPKIKNKEHRKFDGFLDNLIWIGNSNFSMLLREYS